jgi:hypothetical protein
MKKLTPSNMISNEILQGLQEGIDTKEGSQGLLSWLVEKSIQKFFQEILEQQIILEEIVMKEKIKKNLEVTAMVMNLKK